MVPVGPDPPPHEVSTALMTAPLTAKTAPRRPRLRSTPPHSRPVRLGQVAPCCHQLPVTSGPPDNGLEDQTLAAVSRHASVESKVAATSSGLKQKNSAATASAPASA